MMMMSMMIIDPLCFVSQVWPNHGANLVVMERYHFFCTSRRQFGVQAKSLTEAHRDESEADGTLATVLQTLLKVHHNFFNTPPLPVGIHACLVCSRMHAVVGVSRTGRQVGW